MLIFAMVIHEIRLSSWDSILINHTVSQVWNGLIQDNWRPNIFNIENFSTGASCKSSHSQMLKLRAVRSNLKMPFCSDLDFATLMNLIRWTHGETAGLFKVFLSFFRFSELAEHNSVMKHCDSLHFRLDRILLIVRVRLLRRRLWCFYSLLHIVAITRDPLLSMYLGNSRFWTSHSLRSLLA